MGLGWAEPSLHAGDPFSSGMWPVLLSGSSAGAWLCGKGAGQTLTQHWAGGMGWEPLCSQNLNEEYWE